MKINTVKMSYEEVLKQPRLEHKPPRKPAAWLAAVVRIASIPSLMKTKFSYTTEDMEKVGAVSEYMAYISTDAEIGVEKS